MNLLLIVIFRYLRVLFSPQRLGWGEYVSKNRQEPSFLQPEGFLLGRGHKGEEMDCHLLSGGKQRDIIEA